jgi:hypothetical protein
MIPMKLSVSCGLLMIVATGCSSKGGGSTSASASAATGTVKPTCDDAGRRYGEFTAKMMIADPKNPVPAEKRKLLADPIRDATVKSCQEDKWDDLPLSCLASVFEHPPKDDAELDKYTDVCVKSVGKEKLAKMDQRVVHAMTDAVLPTPASAAPEASGSSASSPAASGPAATSAVASPSPADAAKKGAPASPPPKPPAPKPPSAGDAF